jgi:release factor glutamine methyltransferase
VLYSELFARSLQKLGRHELTAAVEVLIERAFNLSRTQFWIRRNQEIDNARKLAAFRRAFSRLLKDEPLAYITGEKEFYSHPFTVNRRVLIPRPETEFLVEKALALNPPPATILDIGAGSGNIAVSLALRSDARVWALEKSRAAHSVLKRNIARFALGTSIIPLLADLFPGRPIRFDLIVSNPPYLSCREWDRLPRMIRDFEPREALVAGPKGTEVIEEIICRAPGFLNAGGCLLLEAGKGQHRRVSRLLTESGFSGIEWIRDFQGIPRVVLARR